MNCQFTTLERIPNPNHNPGVLTIKLSYRYFLCTTPDPWYYMDFSWCYILSNYIYNDVFVIKWNRDNYIIVYTNIIKLTIMIFVVLIMWIFHLPVKFMKNNFSKFQIISCIDRPWWMEVYFLCYTDKPDIIWVLTVDLFSDIYSSDIHMYNISTDRFV